MFKNDLADRISYMLTRSRMVSGKTQNEVAEKIGVSTKTIKNWESGYSCPSILESFKWFEAIDSPIFPYINYVCHASEDGFIKTNDLKSKKQRLKDIVDNSTEHEIDALLFMLEGEHGANVAGVLDGFLAYLQLPLKYRVGIMQNIGTHYLLCKADNSLSHPDKVQPNTEILHEYVKVGIKAVLQGKKTYI